MNEAAAVRTAFYQKAACDARIGPTHIALFMALCQLWERDAKGGLQVRELRARVMALAKINSTATYHKALRDLVIGDYLVYRPSFQRGRGSGFELLPPTP